MAASSPSIPAMPTDLPETRPMRRSLLTLACLLALTACDRGATPPATTEAPAPAVAAPAPPPTTCKPATPITAKDEHSYAEPAKVCTKDLALDLALDFVSKTLAGTATLTLEWIDPAATQLVLDTRDLTIEKVEGADAAGTWAPLQFALAGEADPLLGSKLTIQTPTRPAQVRITYRTAPTASGLQWLEPSMTAGKQQPFMFSQSQQIHAR